MSDPKLRVDIISDTHSHLSKELLDTLQGADLIIHAGDICSVDNFEELSKIAPIMACLGNNDYPGMYGDDVVRILNFFWQGLRFQVCHYQERLVPESADIYVCGHTHRPCIQNFGTHGLLINPGSPTYPRTMMGPTMARLFIEDEKVVSSEIIQL